MHVAILPIIAIMIAGGASPPEPRVTQPPITVSDPIDRLADPPHYCPPNGPSFIDLTTGDKNQFLLHLVPDGASRFAPVSGQLDPAMDSVTIFHPK
jgi:hypothetical protein